MFKDRRLEILSLADCALHTEDGYTFPAHKNILAMRSGYFSSIFCSPGEENAEVSVRGIKGGILGNVLSFIYNGTLHVTEENVSGLMLASHILLLPDILTTTKAVLKENLTFNNSIAVLTAANSINDVDVARRSFRFIEFHFERILRESNNFLEIPLEELILFLKDRNLRVNNEYTVWLAIREWVEANLPTRLPLVPELLKCLAVGEVNEHLANEILSHDIVLHNEFCKKIFNKKLLHSNYNPSRILQNFLLSNPEVNLFSNTFRNPPSLHLFTCFSEDVGAVDTYRIYVTYDDKIDVWRKFVDIEDTASGRVVSLDGSIYVYARYREFRRYSVADEEWYQCRYFREAHISKFVVLGRMIYALGYDLSDDRPLPEKCPVHFYNPEVDDWYEIAPMFHMKYFQASVLDDCIYMVGCIPHSESELIAQVYDARRQVWNLIPAPSVLKHIRGLVAFHGKIYIIGSKRENYLETVEVFDPSRNVWYAVEGLPYTYVDVFENDFTMNVINDHLIVSGKQNEDCRTGDLYSTVMWNEDGQCWKVLEGPSPKSKLCFYSFCTLKEPEMVNIISKKNKDPGTVFQETSFGDTHL